MNESCASAEVFFDPGRKNLVKNCVRVPGKALLFGEYGLLQGLPGVVLTVPEFSFFVEMQSQPASSDVVVSCESPHYAGGALHVSRDQWLRAEKILSQDFSRAELLRAFASEPQADEMCSLIGILFPYATLLREPKQTLKIQVHHCFSPALGLGSSSAFLTALHALARRRCEESNLEMPEKWSAVEASLRLTQGRGSGYDILAQWEALNTLSPRLYWVSPFGSECPGCEDITLQAFNKWSEELQRHPHFAKARGTGARGFRIVPSGVYAPTASLLLKKSTAKSHKPVHLTTPAKLEVDEKNFGQQHAALAADWKRAGFSLAKLPDLFARSREIAKEQGLFGEPSTPFHSACQDWQVTGTPFKTMGAGYGDSLLVLEGEGLLVPEPAESSVFSIEKFLRSYFGQELVTLQEKLLAARLSGALFFQPGDEGCASAPSNIALLKYWGKESHLLQTPCNSSLSMTLGSFRSFTRVEILNAGLPVAHWFAGGQPKSFAIATPHQFFFGGAQTPSPDAKVEGFLKRVLRDFAPDLALRVESQNTFPTACGIASSASGFAALAGALWDGLGLERVLNLSEKNIWISQWARIGSGSATRSCGEQESSPFVSWHLKGLQNLSNPLEVHQEFRHLEHVVIVFDEQKKKVSSSDGHKGVWSSPFQWLRHAQVEKAFADLERALQKGDFFRVAELTENDAFAMHAVMFTTKVPTPYFDHPTAQFLAEFVRWRNEKQVKAFWTLDAGPNVHVLMHPSVRPELEMFFRTQNLKKCLWNQSARGLALGKQSFVSLHESPLSRPYVIEVRHGN
jgi:diphosphomevalonate decarboxylase